jgi:hypothetical protein
MEKKKARMNLRTIVRFWIACAIVACTLTIAAAAQVGGDPKHRLDGENSAEHVAGACAGQHESTSMYTAR